MTRDARLLASVGARLLDYDLTLATGALNERTVTLAAEKIDYACADIERRHLYVISSDGRPGVAGERHQLQVLSLARNGRALREVGAPQRLDQRALHVTIDRAARHLLIAYGIPSVVEVWRLRADGTVEGRVSRFECGHFAHQVLLDEARGLAIVVARGIDASAQRAESPGSLQVFDYHDGALTPRATVAPEDGYGFGPRNAALETRGEWLCVSLERQSRLCVFGIGAAGVSPAPVCSMTTLTAPENVRPRQLGGMLGVSPDGRYIYVANRADHTVEAAGQPVFGGGENSLAVFSMNPADGALSLVERVDCGGFYPRTFAIDRSGTRLIVANGKSMTVRDGDAVRYVPANIAVFEIAPSGRLTLLRTNAIDTGAQSLFWSDLLE
ncbi:MAG TPA: beta-propeller fold lactonase family protein [Paraburkholderia sp.]|jgi:6-phosphogluconolactonase (cycloisomerase 2 family)